MNATGGSLTMLGREQARDLGERLRSEKVAAVMCSELSRAVQTAEIAAGVLGLPVRVRERLHEFPAGDYLGHPLRARLLRPGWSGPGSPATSRVGVPGGETGRETADRVLGVLEEVADQFRGETVLVVTPRRRDPRAVGRDRARVSPTHRPSDRRPQRLVVRVRARRRRRGAWPAELPEQAAVRRRRGRLEHLVAHLGRHLAQRAVHVELGEAVHGGPAGHVGALAAFGRERARTSTSSSRTALRTPYGPARVAGVVRGRPRPRVR